MCNATVQHAGQCIQPMAEMAPPLVQATVSAVEINKQTMQQAQNLLDAPMYLQNAILQARRCLGQSRQLTVVADREWSRVSRKVLP
ncbi:MULTISPECIES: hypothetical protein [unclassified Delftia]|uniref:hypothetical protein n=1 Tax=unclassified Delftia TaxID=2613839 RepID=UPI0006457A9D|nr:MULTISPECIES: hypothetical protein [unclassified Delftia]MDC2859242.1 hypothetical protein [Delftia sp. DT-2]